MKVKEINNPVILSLLKNQIEEYCKKIEYKELFDIDYHNHSSLLYEIYTKRSYVKPNGSLFLIYDNNHIISISGTQRYNDDICFLAKRHSIVKEHRGKGLYSYHMLQPQVEWAKKNGYKMGLFTWNEDREILYKIYKKISRGRCRWSGVADMYKDKLIVYDGVYKINGVPQYVMGYKIDENFEWSPNESRR